MLALAFLVVGLTANQVPILDLHCNLDPAQSRMHVTATVVMAPNSEPKQTADFFLSDLMDVPSVAILEPKDLAGQVTAKALSTRDHDVTYEIALPKALPPGVRLKLSFDYQSKVPKGFVYLLSPKECLAGGYNTCWFPSVGESRHMLGNLEFKSPSGYIVKASGKEIPATETSDQRDSRFEILQPTVPTFAAARFVVTHVAGTVPMALYLLKARPISEEYANGCSKILDVLTKQNGPYPFPDFSIIETPSPDSSRDLGFSGASFEGFMFGDSDGIDGGFNLAYYGHEIGHQWWGNLVGLNGDKGSYIFSEGLAQFGSLQCVKTIDGVDLAEQYRRWGYPNYSDRQCIFGSLFYGRCGYDRALLNPPATYSVLMHQLANSKGFLVWETLARTMGHQNFNDALKAIAHSCAWSNVTWEQLFAELQRHTKVDLGLFQEEWFNRTGAPCAWSTWKVAGNKLHVTLHQTDPTYHLQMPLVIRDKNGKVEERDVSFSTVSQELDLPISDQVLSCELDPHFEVYHTTPDLSAMVQSMKGYGDARFFMPLLGNMDGIEARIRESLKVVPDEDQSGAEFLEHIYLSAVLFNAKKYDEASAQCDLVLACPVRRSDLLPLLYLRRARIAKEAGQGDVKRLLDQYMISERASPWPSGTLSQAKTLFPDYPFSK